ncbi:MAG TPA: hypothetical protein VGE99_11000 [Candidatus Dormibacteraeota bacterium]
MDPSFGHAATFGSRYVKQAELVANQLTIVGRSVNLGSNSSAEFWQQGEVTRGLR